MNNGKTILLACPNDYELHNLIEKNLIYLGFKVVKIISTSIPSFKYPNFKSRIINFCKKKFLKDINYKNQLIADFYSNVHFTTISKHDNFDFALFIRADFFSDKILEFAKSKTKKMISYHYDGLSRSPEIFGKIKYFNDFFVFDNDDLQNKKYALKPCTNFYFDFDINDKIEIIDVNFDSYFLGSFDESRMQKILDYNQIMTNNNLICATDLAFNKSNRKYAISLKNKNINCLKKIMPFGEYIEKIKKSKIIVDFVIDAHKGLSFRVFESLKYEKKLVTTNQNILNYDFYNPKNIFVLTDDNFASLNDFIKTDYEKIPDRIRFKYSFTNWINYICGNANALSINIH